VEKRFWLILTVVVVVLIGVFILTGGKADNSGSDFAGDATQVQNDDNIVNPEASRDVVLIEYGDFECPGCAALHPVLKQVETEFSDTVTFIFRHFPLTSIHQNAFAAHRAAEAAGRQGQFYGMHDLLYENQETWNGPSAVDPNGATIDQAAAIFEQFAAQLNLDIEQFKADYASEGVANFINTQLDSGRQLDIASTPTLLLNGQQIATPSSLEELSQTLQSAVDEAANNQQTDQ